MQCTRRILCTKLCKYRRCDVGNAIREKLTSRLSQLSITNQREDALKRITSCTHPLATTAREVARTVTHPQVDKLLSPLMSPQIKTTRYIRTRPVSTATRGATCWPAEHDVMNGQMPLEPALKCIHITRPTRLENVTQDISHHSTPRNQQRRRTMVSDTGTLVS